MKMIGIKSLATAGFLTLTASAQATPFLSVDFGTMGGTKSPRQTDFLYFKDGVGVGNNAGPISQSYTGFDSSFTNASGIVTVTTNNGTNLTSTTTMTTRDSGSVNSSLVSYAYGNLYRDQIIASSNTMTIGISGLTAGMQYEVTFYAYNDAAAATATFTNWTSGSADTANAQSITWTSSFQFSAATPNDIFARTFVVTANGSGDIIFRNLASSGSALLDGLTIATVPEPAALTLAIAPLAALFIKRRK